MQCQILFMHICTQVISSIVIYQWQILFNVTLSDGFKFTKWLHILIWLIDKTLQITTLWVRVGLGLKLMKGYSYSPKLQDLNLTSRCFSVISWTLIGWGVLLLFRNAVGIFYGLSQLSWLVCGNIYIYIYMCVCVWSAACWLNNQDTFCLYNLIKILSNFLILILG